MWAQHLEFPVVEGKPTAAAPGSKSEGLTLSLRVGSSVSERLSWVICLYLNQSLGPKKKKEE